MIRNIRAAAQKEAAEIGESSKLGSCRIGRVCVGRQRRRPARVRSVDSSYWLVSWSWLDGDGGHNNGAAAALRLVGTMSGNERPRAVATLSTTWQLVASLGIRFAPAR
jgi:hypothetical protein